MRNRSSRGESGRGDQPAHVERHGCSLMWLQLGSPGPNEVLWSSAAPSRIAYTPAAHILPWLHHSGSLRRCSQIPPGTLKEKRKKAEIGRQEFGLELHSSRQQPHPAWRTHTHTYTHQAYPWPTLSSMSSICLSKERCSCDIMNSKNDSDSLHSDGGALWVLLYYLKRKRN